MERVSFDIERQDVADALHAQADAHGRTVEAELAALVERTYGRQSRAAAAPQDDNWVQELLDLAKKIDLPDGLGPYLPRRITEAYKPIKL